MICLIRLFGVETQNILFRGEPGFTAEKLPEILLILEAAFLAYRCYIRLALTEKDYCLLQFVIVDKTYQRQPGNGSDFLIQGRMAHGEHCCHGFDIEIVFGKMLLDYFLASHQEHAVFFRNAGGNSLLFLLLEKFVDTDFQLLQRYGFKQICVRSLFQGFQQVFF